MDSSHRRPGTRASTPRAAVLVLHGGKVRSHARTRPWHLSVARARWLAADLRRSLTPEAVSVVRLRFSVRGWNGPERSPVADAWAALDRLAVRLPLVPVVVAGHSMGGRAAVAVADHPSVTGVVALAPWLPADESVTPLRGRLLSVLHGTDDTWTSPAMSRDFVDRARRAGVAAGFTPIDGGGHFMLRHPGRWRAETLAAVQAHRDPSAPEHDDPWCPVDGGAA